MDQIKNREELLSLPDDRTSRRIVQHDVHDENNPTDCLDYHISIVDIHPVLAFHTKATDNDVLHNRTRRQTSN